MGRLIAQVKITNATQAAHSIVLDALVDTGAANLVLPAAWKSRLGKLNKARNVRVQLGDQSEKIGEMWGPVQIQLQGFQPIYGEILFVEMEEHEGSYEPLLGYIPLEQSQAAVDMVGHRLVPVKTVDLKCALV